MDPNDRDTRSGAYALPSQRGFTLVELMVVVAIIALLAAIIIPNFVHARAQASVSQTEANMKQIATALEVYYADRQDYPTAGNLVGPGLFGGATNPYLTVVPVNAIGRQPYGYAYVPLANGVPPHYTLTDPSKYDPTTLSNLTKGAGGTAGCAQTCTSIQYDPQNGFYGT
ncbi:MAG: hypothetical protein NVS3B16_13260 [Vulcanimicrobiaceae bacterium]